MEMMVIVVQGSYYVILSRWVRDITAKDPGFGRSLAFILGMWGGVHIVRSASGQVRCVTAKRADVQPPGAPALPIEHAPHCILRMDVCQPKRTWASRETFGNAGTCLHALA